MDKNPFYYIFWDKTGNTAGIHFLIPCRPEVSIFKIPTTIFTRPTKKGMPRSSELWAFASELLDLARLCLHKGSNGNPKPETTRV